MFDYFTQVYSNFLGYFPGFLQPYVALAVAALLIWAIFGFIKRNFIGIILLIVLLPASIPILKKALEYVIQFLKFVLGF